MLRKTVYLISGFQGHGKNRLSECGNIYEDYSIFSSDSQHKLPVNFLDSKHLAFATTLRDLIHPLFGLELDSSEYEKYKDQEGFIEPYNGTIRDYFKAIAKSIKVIDPEFFVKSIVKAIRSSDNNSFVITDFRFKEERDYLVNTLTDFDIITIRVHRAAGPEPKLDGVISENSLLDIKVDFVLLTKMDEERDCESHNMYYICKV